MDKYSKSALNAVNYIVEERINNPVEAWTFATGEQFGEGSWGQKKGCPKNAFLGICEEGLVRGVKAGKYNKRKNSLNKQYAINTINLLKEDPSYFKKDNKEIWSIVTNGKSIKSNYQVEIVKALWERGLIL